MASAWGGSWGSSWGNSWGAVSGAGGADATAGVLPGSETARRERLRRIERNRARRARKRADARRVRQLALSQELMRLALIPTELTQQDLEALDILARQRAIILAQEKLESFVRQDLLRRRQDEEAAATIMEAILLS